MVQQKIGRLGGNVARLLALALALGVALGLSVAGPRAVVSAQELASGVRVGMVADGQELGDEAMVVAEDLAYRDGPGLDTTVLAVLPYGTRGTLTDGPVAADGYTWYEFSVDDYGAGWVAGEFLARLVDGAGGFAIGTGVIVAADGLNLRAEPGLIGAILDTLPSGMQLMITDGPVVSDGITWYQVATEDVTEAAGWVAREFLSLP